MTDNWWHTWGAWILATVIGIIAVAVTALFSSEKVADVIITLVSIVVPVMIGSHAHVHHARIMKKG